MVDEIHSQQTQLDFIPASENFYPHINSYSSSEGLKQYYLEDSKWVRNESIPSFEDKEKFIDIGMQYISGDKVNSPQLFVYSRFTGDFSFYFLSEEGWALNENIPSGKINIKSNRINADYVPSVGDRSSYIFSYTSDGSKIELLKITENGWRQNEYFPLLLPQG